MQREVLLWTSPKYPGNESMLFQENINYGFRRTASGVSQFGIIATTLVICGCA